MAITGELVVRALGLPQRISGWKSRQYPSHELNQFGYRGARLEAQEGESVIVLLGDSFVESAASPIEEMPERLLEKKLRKMGLPVKVVSLGAAGYGQDQQLLALREFFQSQKASLVLMWVTPTNDVWNNMFPTHQGTWWKPTFRVKDGALLPSEEEWLQPAPPIGSSLWALIRQEVFDASPADYDKMWAAELPPPYQPSKNRPSEPVGRTWQDMAEKDPRFSSERFDIGRHHNQLYLNPPGPREEYGIQLTHLLSREIQNLCQQNGAEFAVFSSLDWDQWPHGDPEKDQHWMELEGLYYAISEHRFRANLETLYQGMRVIQVPCTVADWQVSPTDAHFNQSALDQVFGDLAEGVAHDYRIQLSSQR